jgi:hypothetical protein
VNNKERMMKRQIKTSALSMTKTILFSLVIGALCFGPWYCLVLAGLLIIPFMEY